MELFLHERADERVLKSKRMRYVKNTIFNITNTSKEWLYNFTRLSSGKEWRVFNANNNYGGLYIADTGTWRKLPGGSNASYIYVPPKFLTPAMSSDIIGAGVFVSYISDIDW